MKLTNVHYEYRGNDVWRIYFKDYKEAEAFRNERIDGQKAQIAMLLAIFTNGKGVRYCVEAKLEGQFNILRHYTKDPVNNYFSNDVWRALVKKIEGAGTDCIFDEIDLWYVATVDKCCFKICRMNGIWTEPFARVMLNSRFGMVAQANGYSDTDTVGEGGLCARHRCCGIGFDPNEYMTEMDRIIFTVKNFCRGVADIIKASPWTNTFIGTNKENEKEYSWADFKQYMQKLSANGSDIWDIEWEYDVACPMTGTNVADKVHVYLKPETYKRLFERDEKEEPKQLLKNITDVLPSATKVIVGCSTLHYYNLYFDYKSDLKHINEKYIERSVFNRVKGTYYIQVVSYNNKLPKNISSAILVWDQEENRYSVESFTIKKDQNVPALTPPPAPTWLNLGKDCKIGFRQKDVDEVKKEIDEMTKKIYEKLEIKQVKDFDTATAWHEYLTATETALFVADGKKKEVKNKEEKNMEIKDICKAKIKPTKILIQGTATIIWWSDDTKTVVKCQKGDKMDPEKGIAMCVMKKFMGTNETHSNYLDFAKDAIETYEKQQAAEKAKKKAEYDKRRREAAKKKGTDGNANYKRTTKKNPIDKEES